MNVCAFINRAMKSSCKKSVSVGFVLSEQTLARSKLERVISVRLLPDRFLMVFCFLWFVFSLSGRLLLQPQERVFSASFRSVERLHVCRKDLSEVQVRVSSQLGTFMVRLPWKWCKDLEGTWHCWNLFFKCEMKRNVFDISCSFPCFSRREVYNIWLSRFCRHWINIIKKQN